MYTFSSPSHGYVTSAKARAWLLRDEAPDEKSTMFRFNKDDYFVTLASVLDLMAHMLERCREVGRPPLPEHIEVLRHLKDELEFLQNRCRIVER